MRKRFFKDYVEAEDFAGELVFGGDAGIEAELVETWPDADTFDRASLTDAWGDLYVVWGTPEEVDLAVELLGPYVDSKGRVARMEEE